jgi:predicted AlkP superfamily phosphohydrolase/phosphomutase
VLISIDALSEARVQGLPRDVAPHLHALFEEGACAAYAVPAFPSVTAPGHAAIATGAWGDVNGVAANRQPRLPQDRNRLTELDDAYRFGPLRAEPIWITAALAGLDVVSLHFTQSPQPPGYPPRWKCGAASRTPSPHTASVRSGRWPCRARPC